MTVPVSERRGHGFTLAEQDAPCYVEEVQVDPPICLPSYSGWSIREVSAEIQAFFHKYADSTVWQGGAHSWQECYQRWASLKTLE